LLIYLEIHIRLSKNIKLKLKNYNNKSTENSKEKNQNLNNLLGVVKIDINSHQVSLNLDKKVYLRSVAMMQSRIQN